ncbi:DUF4302 domain-containing protein [Chitinophaga sp.]|uniref:DUF4302 domain-containing protein n=1 Tax=Chitinophaga sp. TaxID=1869181 RepID=UPI002F94BA22
MIKYLVYILTFVMIISSCRKDLHSSVFDKSADQRLNTVLTDYQSILVAAPYGWVANVVPALETNEKIYSFWFKFNDSNRVVSRWKAEPPLTSSYRLKALQRPELIFDTYTYLHLLADAEKKVPGAAAGTGLKSDFELEIISAAADSFVFKGRYNGADVTFQKATAGDTAGNVRVLGHYPLAGSYQATAVRILYATTAADSLVGSIGNFKGIKEFSPSKYADTVVVDYGDLGNSNWRYRIALTADGQGITVTPNATMESQIKPGSFKILAQSYDRGSGRIYLKSFYTNSAGADRVTEETFIRR